jgi:four helix bundle protein
MPDEQDIIYLESKSPQLRASTEFARQVHGLCLACKAPNRFEGSSTLQMYRAGTSVAANIREGRFAESKRDFIHKLKIAEKELAEFYFWFGMLATTQTQWPDDLKCAINQQAAYIRNMLRKALSSARESTT